MSPLATFVIAASINKAGQIPRLLLTTMTMCFGTIWLCALSLALEGWWGATVSQSLAVSCFVGTLVGAMMLFPEWGTCGRLAFMQLGALVICSLSLALLTGLLSLARAHAIPWVDEHGLALIMGGNLLIVALVLINRAYTLGLALPIADPLVVGPAIRERGTIVCAVSLVQGVLIFLCGGGVMSLPLFLLIVTVVVIWDYVRVVRYAKAVARTVDSPCGGKSGREDEDAIGDRRQTASRSRS